MFWSNFWFCLTIGEVNIKVSTQQYCFLSSEHLILKEKIGVNFIYEQAYSCILN